MRVDTKKWLHQISKHPKDVEKEYDEISHYYDNSVSEKGYLAPQHACELIRKYSPDSNNTILEAGCGTGLLGEQLSKYGYSNITGIDISNACLQKAKEKDVYIKIQKHDLLKPFPFADNYFDCVACVGVFSRFDDTKIQKIINEFTRIIKNDGIIIFSHRNDLITPQLKKILQKINRLKLEHLTAPLIYFEKDEHYSDINIRFFILRKSN